MSERRTNSEQVSRSEYTRVDGNGIKKTRIKPIETTGSPLKRGKIKLGVDKSNFNINLGIFHSVKKLSLFLPALWGDTGRWFNLFVHFDPEFRYSRRLISH